MFHNHYKNMEFKLVRIIVMGIKYSFYGTLIQVFLVASLMAFEGNAQYTSVKDTDVNIEINDSSMEEVFRQIEDQTNFTFFYDKGRLRNKVVKERKKGVYKVSDVLMAVSKEAKVQFRQVNNNIAVSPMPEKDLVDTSVEVIIEDISISGKVMDESGNPLPGASVTVKESADLGTIADIDGNYKITAPDNATLVVSFIGYATREIDISNRSTIDVMLAEDMQTLQEVVVTGYQNLSKERTAGSFDRVEEEQMEQRPSSPDFISRLDGQVSGLNVTPTGQLQVRGRGTVFNGQDSPLIVVDGFPLADQANLESINPEDIESVTVLKDAAASSIWGSRASNGVIVVVTKKGGKNRPLSVNFSSFFEIEKKVDLDDMNWLSTDQEITLDQEFIDKGWVNFNTLVNVNESINDLHMAYVYRNGLSPDGTIWSQNTFDNYINELKSRDIANDWEKYMLRNAARQTYNLALSGGGDRNSFYGSLSYTDYKASSVGNENDRITLNIRNIFDFSDRISFTTGLTTALRNKSMNALESYYGQSDEGGNVSMAALSQPYDRLVDANGQYEQMYTRWNPWVSQDREALLGSQYTFNQLQEMENRDESATLMDVRADFRLDVEVIKGLKLSSAFRYERNTNDIDDFESMDLPSWRNFVNDYYVADEYQIPVGTNYAQTRGYSKGWVFRNTIDWEKTFAEDHSIVLFAGAEYSRRYTESIFNRQFGYSKQSVTYQPIDEANLANYGVSNWNNNRLYDYRSDNLFDVNNRDNRFVSVFGNMAYTFKEKYILNGSYRIDQANIFGSDPDFRYKPLWSVGLGWEASKEAFLENVDWLSYLKVRATYGLGGNSINSASPYPSARTRNIGWGYYYNSLVLSQPGNPGLKWEETATTDFGIDFAVFNNRLSGSLDYYKKKSTDVYAYRGLDPTVGFSYAPVNYADIENKGLELALNANIIQTQNFRWSVRANFNRNTNEVTKYDDAAISVDGYTGGTGIEEGKPSNMLYSYNFAGLNDNGEMLVYDTEGNTKLWSEAIEKEELVYEGSLTPTSYGGLSSTVKYKGFDLTVNLKYQAGFVVRSKYDYVSTGFGTGNNTDYDFSNKRIHEVWANRWMQPGDEATTSVPKVFYNGVNPTTGLVESRFNTGTMNRMWVQSTYATHKGDYIRVQDIILGYNVPVALLQKVHVKSMRFSVQVANPFLWTANDAGIDPSAPGAEAYLNLPRFTFGFRTTF